MSGIYLTLQERMTLLQNRVNMANAMVAKSQEIANITFVKMAEQGLIGTEVMAEHIDAFPEVEDGEALPNGALRKIDGELVQVVVKEVLATGKTPAYTKTTFESVKNLFAINK